MKTSRGNYPAGAHGKRLEYRKTPCPQPILPLGSSILVSMFKLLLLHQDYTIKFYLVVGDNSTSSSPCAASNARAS